MQMKHGVRPLHAAGDVPGDGVVHTPSRAPSRRQTSAARSHTVTGSDGVPAGLLWLDDPDDPQPAAETARMMAAIRIQDTSSVSDDQLRTVHR